MKARLAWARAWYGLRNLAFDVRYGAPLLGRKDTGVEGHAQVVNSDYSLYPHVFARVPIRATDVVVDIGAGRGRFINWVLSRRTGARIVGIEYDRETAERTARRLARHDRVTIIQGDATELIPRDGTIFFLFNPFEEVLMRRFRDSIERVYAGRSSPTVVYLRPLELAVFRESPRWLIEEHEILEVALDARYASQASHRRYALLRLAA